MLHATGGLRPYLQALLVVLCLTTQACGDDVAQTDGQRTDGDAVTEAVAEEPQLEPSLRPFLPDEMQRSTRAESFPHPAHQQISCAVCHDSPQGHASHGEIACADCHRASQNVTVAALAPEDCQSCHHSPSQSRSCETCHESRPTVVSTQLLEMEVWDAPRPRSFDFDHGLHGDLSCQSCHRALPSLTPAESCASCHANHHTAEVRCASCHVAPPPTAHDVQAHVTCSGSGCHRARDVEAIATARPVCLVCHTDQEEHEPGGNCIACHRVRGDPVASASWRHR